MSRPAGADAAERRPQSLLVNIAFATLVATFFLALLEGIGRAWERLSPPPVLAEYLWKWEERWDGDFYTVRQAGTGWPRHEEFNPEGVRDVSHPPEKPEGTWRVAFLGDSVTLGAGVEPHESYPRVLQRRLDAAGRRIEVLNVSLWGWSTRQQRHAYQRIARRYAPDQVVVAVCLNDIPELQNNLARPPGWLLALHRRSALVRKLVNAEGREIQDVEQLFTQPDAKKVTEAFDRFFEELRVLRAEVEKDGARFAVVVFPFRFQVLPGAPPPLVQERIAAFCAAENLRCHDTLPAIRELGADAFVDYDHFSARGGERVADDILAAGLLPAGRGAADHLGDVRDVPGLVRLLQDPDAERRWAATWALQQQGPAAGAAVPALVAALRDEREQVRAGAAAALGAVGAVGARAHGAVPALLEALADRRQSVRWRAADALDQIGLARTELPSLTRHLQNTDAHLRAFAAYQIGKLGPGASGAAAELLRALRDEPGVLPGRAAQALGSVPAAVRHALAELTPELEHEDAGVRTKAAIALGKIGPRAAPAVDALARRLEDDSAGVREHAAIALGHVGPDARTAVAPLAATLRDHELLVRAAAARALGKIGPDAAPALDALRATLRDPEPSVRAQAARAIGHLGPAALAATADLQRARGDEAVEVSRQATKALKRLRHGGVSEAEEEESLR